MNALHNLPGTALTDLDYQMLKRSLISRELADQALLRRVSDAEARMIVGANGRQGDFSGVIFTGVRWILPDFRPT